MKPKVKKLVLTTHEKIAMIDKLYLMHLKGEITEAEYLEKKKALLKDM